MDGGFVVTWETIVTVVGWLGSLFGLWNRLQARISSLRESVAVLRSDVDELKNDDLKLMRDTLENRREDVRMLFSKLEDAARERASIRESLATKAGLRTLHDCRREVDEG